MEEKGFEFSFDEVSYYENDGKGLRGGGGWSQKFVEERVNEDRTDVFDEEDGAPGNLRAFGIGRKRS